MSKIVKFSLYLICCFLLVITLGAITMLLIFDPNHYKQEISQKFYSMTGCQLEINGEISWTFFPTLSLEIHQAVIKNPPTYPIDKPLASIGTIALSIKLMPLFNKHVETKNIKVRDVSINIINKSAKQQNITTLMDHFKQNQPQVKPEAGAQMQADSKQDTGIYQDDFKITINNVTVNNAKINWINLINNQYATFLIDNLQSSHINLIGTPFPISLVLNTETNDPEARSSIKFVTNAQINIARGYCQFNNIKAQAKLTGPRIPNQKMNISMGSNIKYEFKKAELTISDITAAINNLSMQGDLNGKITQPSFTGQLKAKRFDTFKWLQSLGFHINIPEPTLFENTKFNIDYEVTPQQIKINKFKFNLNDTTHGFGYISLTKNLQSKLIANISIDQVNLDQILPLEISHETLPKITHSNSGQLLKKIKIPTQNTDRAQISRTHDLKAYTIDHINADIHLEKFQYKNIKMSHVDSKVNLKDDILSFTLSEANFYNGKISGMNQFTLDSQPLRFNINEIFKNIDVNQFLIDLLNKNLIHGRTTGSINLYGAGKTLDELIPTLTGTSKIIIEDGELDIMDGQYLLEYAIAKYQKAQLPNTPTKRTTRFKLIDAEFTIKNGVAKTNKLLMQSRSLDATGKGKIDLTKQKIDVKINLVYTGKRSDLLEVQQKVGGSIPMTLRGQYDHINAQIDYPLLLRNAATMKVGKTIEDSVEKIGANINKSLDSMNRELQNFFGK